MLISLVLENVLLGQADPLTAGYQPWEMLNISGLRVHDAICMEYSLAYPLKHRHFHVCTVCKNPVHFYKDGFSVEIE